MGLIRSPYCSAYPTWLGGSSFPGLVSPSDTVSSESVVAIKPGDSGVVIGYHIEEFTHTWSAEHLLLNYTLPYIHR